MNFEYFYARRITLRHQRKISKLVVRLAVLSIAIAIASMEISLSVVQGFESAIQNKVVGFGSHIQVGWYASQQQEVNPINQDSAFIKEVSALPAVAQISPFVKQMSIIQSKRRKEKTGLIFKGVDASYDWSFFKNSLQKGRLPDFATEKSSKEILVSKKQAQLLGLNVDEKATLFFLDQTPVRRRAVKVVGIYETGMEEFDEHIAICDMRMLQKIKRWESNQIEGYEINLHDLATLDSTAERINLMSLDYAIMPITRLYPEIFMWLDLQHQNVDLILLLMTIVAVINLISVVLILIIERTRDIGILKALGLSNGRVQVLFVWNAFFLILMGVLLGNLLGLGILWTQEKFHWITMDQENYFVKVMPVAWVWGKFLWVNLGVIAICTVCMLIPTFIIGRISPIKAIRFG